MDPYIKVGSDFYLLASSAASRRTTRVLADGESFAVFDASGDIASSPLEALGFFHADTRFLSRFELRLDSEFPYYLNSYLSSDKTQLRANLTNPDLRSEVDLIRLERDSLHLQRSWALDSPGLYHRLSLTNFASREIPITLCFYFATDFADLFEVRGVHRQRRGQLFEAEAGHDRVLLHYLGLDKIARTTALRFSQVPSLLAGGSAEFSLRLMPEQSWVIETEIQALLQAPPRPWRSFGDGLSARRAKVAALTSAQARIETNHDLTNRVLHESAADLTMLTTGDQRQARVTAGIPWFATLFGRDSIICAISMLPFDPRLAAGTLRLLASMQGRRFDPSREEEPGKIVHEVRGGEMARLGEVPFACYYGSVDATPLFLVLLGRYVRASADLELAAELWPNVEAALNWIEQSGDKDGDGYVEYEGKTPRGLSNQGWKDSHDSISHADGSLAKGPIALCEVQGYVYAAYLAIAEVAAQLGNEVLAERLEERATRLHTRFARDFWLDDEQTVALALDGDKRPCRVMSSNAAHCLAVGLLESDQAEALGRRLLADDMFSGWGIRTLSAREHRYNPMSYHNGSIWPHDNAIALLGLARSHQRERVLRLAEGLLEAALNLRGSLPELFCGFEREAHLGPVPYPVACHPQAWAAASIYMIASAMLGMTLDGIDQRVVLDSPIIPPWLDWLRVERLPVGKDRVSFLARRPVSGSGGAAIEVLDKTGTLVVEIRS